MTDVAREDRDGGSDDKRRPFAEAGVCTFSSSSDVSSSESLAKSIDGVQVVEREELSSLALFGVLAGIDRSSLPFFPWTMATRWTDRVPMVSRVKVEAGVGGVFFFPGVWATVGVGLVIAALGLAGICGGSFCNSASSSEFFGVFAFAGPALLAALTCIVLPDTIESDTRVWVWKS